MSLDFDVIVVGAGPAGAAFATLLALRGICDPSRIALIAERFEAPPAGDEPLDLRVFALSRDSQRLLQRIGAWQALPPARVCAYERMCVWDAAEPLPLDRALRFDCAEIGEPDLGHIVEGRALQWQIQEAARRSGIVAIESAVDAVEIGESAARVRLRDRRGLRAALLVGADGADSPVRAQLSVELRGHSYFQRAIVAHVVTERAHERTAWQCFLPDGPLALLPLADGRSSIVWSVGERRAAALLGLDERGFEDELTAASQQVLGACRLSGVRAGFALRTQHASSYVGPRFALLGDAAHVVHPLAGQGMNLGFRDCAALLEALGGATVEQLGEVRRLRRYERTRKLDNLVAATLFDGLNRLFSNGNPLLAGVRGRGLSAVGRIGPLKRFLAAQAIGAASDLRFDSSLTGTTGDRSSPRR